MNKEVSRRAVLGGLVVGGAFLASGGRLKAEPEAMGDMPYKSFVPGASRSEIPTPEPTVEPMWHWKREEILFGPNAGFQKLREGEEALVYIDPELAGQVNEQVLSGWNNLGLKLRGMPYLELTSDFEMSDIRFLPHEKFTWVEAFNSEGKHDYKSPFGKSTIHSAVLGAGGVVMDNKVGQHELGHAAFGFVDFLTPYEHGKYLENSNLYVNPQKGYDVNKPYAGAMNYMNWNDLDVWFGADDQKMLKVGGFA